MRDRDNIEKVIKMEKQAMKVRHDQIEKTHCLFNEKINSLSPTVRADLDLSSIHPWRGLTFPINGVDGQGPTFEHVAFDVFNNKYPTVEKLTFITEVRVSGTKRKKIRKV